MKLKLTVPLAAFCIALLCSTSNAQMGPMVHGLSSTATESVALQPDGLRLAMKIQAVGKDGKSAIKALNEQKELVRKELTAMNATADSIRFSSTDVNSGSGNDNEARMIRSMRMGGAFGGPGGGDEDDEPALPKVFTASCWTVAKWTLPSKDSDALALLPAMLRQQISARDLDGKKRKPELDAEQLEQYQQMAMMMEQQMGYGSEMQSVRIEFFANVPQDLAAKTTAAAFDRAKQQAEVLAKAAGTKLGKIHTIMSDPRESMREMYRVWNGPNNQNIEAWLKSEPNVEYSASLDNLQLSVSVWLGYVLE